MISCVELSSQVAVEPVIVSPSHHEMESEKVDFLVPLYYTGNKKTVSSFVRQCLHWLKVVVRLISNA